MKQDITIPSIAIAYTSEFLKSTSPESVVLETNCFAIRETNRLEHTIPIPLIRRIPLLPRIMPLYLFLAWVPSCKETIYPILGNSVKRRLKNVTQTLVDEISLAISSYHRCSTIQVLIVPLLSYTIPKDA